MGLTFQNRGKVVAPGLLLIWLGFVSGVAANARECRASRRRDPHTTYESSQLEYVSKHKTLWLHSGKTYLLDSKRESWESHTKGFNSNGAVSAYDPESDMVVLVVGSKTP